MQSLFIVALMANQWKPFSSVSSAFTHNEGFYSVQIIMQITPDSFLKIILIETDNFLCYNEVS